MGGIVGLDWTSINSKLQLMRVEVDPDQVRGLELMGDVIVAEWAKRD